MFNQQGSKGGKIKTHFHRVRDAEAWMDSSPFCHLSLRVHTIPVHCTFRSLWGREGFEINTMKYSHCHWLCCPSFITCIFVHFGEQRRKLWRAVNDATELSMPGENNSCEKVIAHNFLGRRWSILLVWHRPEDNRVCILVAYGRCNNAMHFVLQ